MQIEQLKSYARILIKNGVALQKNQTLLINGDVENADFIHIITEEAYLLGAKEVIVNWRDGFIARQRLLHASEEVLENPKSWIPEYYHNMLDEGVAILSLVSANPKLLEGVLPARIAKNSKSVNTVLKFYHDAVMSSSLTWCVAAVPTLLWANLIQLEGTDEEKINKLWQIILKLCRIDNVSESERFENHMHNLEQRTKTLNTLQLKRLIYSCPNGTNLIIDLPKEHLWLGGAEKSTKGITFNANIPTEEVFSAPYKFGVNGTVYNTKPLSYHGNTIDGFKLTFKDGKIIDFTAEQGEPILKELIETDEGSAYLGEVALVDHYSPISLSNIIYYETLFDENASCHLAIGAAYPINVKNGSSLSESELEKVGLNRSLTHVDFMIGHPEMNIVGITSSNEEVLIMKCGRLQV